jgi:hypothetical protein
MKKVQKKIKVKQSYPARLDPNKRIVRRPWPKTNANTFAHFNICFRNDISARHNSILFASHRLFFPPFYHGPHTSLRILFIP